MIDGCGSCLDWIRTRKLSSRLAREDASAARSAPPRQLAQSAADERIPGSRPFLEEILRDVVRSAPRWKSPHALAHVPEVVWCWAAAFEVESCEIGGGRPSSAVG